jgi:hypothetical protein
MPTINNHLTLTLTSTIVVGAVHYICHVSAKLIVKKCKNCGGYTNFAKFCKNRRINNLIAMKGFVDLVQNNTNNENNWMVDLKMFNKDVKFRVDSGATATFTVTSHEH